MIPAKRFERGNDRSDHQNTQGVIKVEAAIYIKLLAAATYRSYLQILD